MTVTKPQAQMLATLACASRPTGARQWDPDDVMAEIAKVHDRSLPVVACAVIRAAADPKAQRPSVISSPGSHWGDAPLVTPPPSPRTAPTGTRCTICGDPPDAHRLTDHGYQRPRPKPDPESLHTAVDALRAEVAETPPRVANPVRTLDDLAERDLKLKARVEVVREQIPGEPMREVEPPPTPAAPVPAGSAAVPAAAGVSERSE